MAVILGKPAAPIPTTQFVIGQSKTFTAPLTGRIKVIITGGGGQGAFLYNSSSSINSNTGMLQAAAVVAIAKKLSM